jgi:hypothetical protein
VRQNIANRCPEFPGTPESVVVLPPGVRDDFEHGSPGLVIAPWLDIPEDEPEPMKVNETIRDELAVVILTPGMLD